ncbi:MAG: methyltransferase domain-containing protein [Bacteroidales bacterium]|nr:methyltransferase domain-containing protein [Bacteroidales bacterium]MBN2758090.1 methyltransferase domain-containing protein [Bacteroidales bacterium]
MEEIDLQKIFAAKLTDIEFDKLSKFIYTRYGIKMPPAKRIMLQSRLQKRLRALKIYTFKEYVDFVFSKDGQEEVVHMMDVVSTNKTDFYREATHFDYLTNEVLSKIYKENKFVKLWSAGCSSGQEVYTLAIVLSEFASKNPGFDFSIFGTDLSTIVLKKAFDAVYPEEAVSMIPIDIKRKYLMKSKDKSKKLVKVNANLRKKTKYQRLNFMDDHYAVNEKFDIIFCRNVLIYFDRETQEKVINKLCNNLKPGGYFFLGHSESITNIEAPLKQVKPTIYIRE